MKFKITAIHIIILLGVLAFFSSCNGQTSSENTDNGIPESQLIADSPGTSVSTLEEGILLIFQDSQNNLWFGGGDKGVYKYNEKSLVLYTINDGLSSNKILGIQEDKSGNIYFDTEEGVSKFDGHRFTALELIGSNSSKNEWKLEPGDLWFRMGWNRNGPYRYDGKVLHPLEFPKTKQEEAFYAKYPNASYNPYGIYNVYQDNQGSVWFGTASLGVCRYDGKTTSWLFEEHLTTTPAGADFGIRSILEDKNGDYWFCNTRYRYQIIPENSEINESGLLNYSREKGVGYSRDNGEMDFPYFMSIAEDDGGDLWMATYGYGVWRYDGKQLVHYPLKDGETDVLLFSIYKDNTGVLWLGSHNAGVYKYNGVDFEKFEP